MATSLKIPESYHYLHQASVDSTNNVAKQWLEEEAGVPAIMVADVQTAGRGRLDRSWVSEPGNLFMSMLIEDRFNVPNPAHYVLTAGVACAKAIPVGVTLKWPNDVLLQGKKLAGILIERMHYNGVSYIIIGIGVNIVSFPDNENILYPAISLKHAGLEISRDELLGNIVHALDGLLGLPPESVIKQWQQYSYQEGTLLTVKTADATVSGEYTGISPSGELLLRNAQGGIEKVHTGDVMSTNGDIS